MTEDMIAAMLQKIINLDKAGKPLTMRQKRILDAWKKHEKEGLTVDNRTRR